MIEIGRGFLHSACLKECIKQLGVRCFIIVDEALLETYGKPLQAFLKAEQVWAVPSGEACKTQAVKAQIEQQLFENGAGKDSVLVALGGGSVTDLVGFIAATYLRGIPVVYCPTTLMAMVDASVGGKTGINTSFGKNLLGIIRKPHAIFIDLETLQTLPKRSYWAAFSEIIKHALLASNDLLETLKEDKVLFENQTSDAVCSLIEKNIRIKQQFVLDDLHETGKRKALNLGHTVAHALEKASGYTLSHGEAVGAGLIQALRLNHRWGFLEAPVLKQAERLLQQYGFSELPLLQYAFETLWPFLKQDKKNREGQVHFVLLRQLGQVSAPYTQGLTKEALQKRWLS